MFAAEMVTLLMKSQKQPLKRRALYFLRMNATDKGPLSVG